MVPHHPVQGPCGSIECRQRASRPGHAVGGASSAKPIKLALIAVRQGVPQLDQVPVHRPVAPAARRSPATTAGLEPRCKPRDAKPSEVMLDAACIGVASIDGPALSRRRDEERSELRGGRGEIDHSFGAQVVEVSHERLELRNDSEDVGVGDWPTELARAARPGDLPHRRVRLREHVDGATTGTVPCLQRKRLRVRHRWIVRRRLLPGWGG